MKAHIPKTDTGDDYDFMCGTSAFGATVEARHLCHSCVNKTLEIVELLAQAHDELRAAAFHPSQKRRIDKLLKKIDKALGNRAIVDYPTTESLQQRDELGKESAP